MKVNQLRSDMVLARRLCNNFSVLLPAGKVLTNGDIDILLKRYPDLMVSVQEEIVDAAVTFQDDSQDYETSRKARSEVSQLSKQLIVSLKKGKSINGDEMRDLAKSLEVTLNQIRNSMVKVAVIGEPASAENYFKEHATNVFYLSMVVGDTLRHFIGKERNRLTAVKSLSNSMDLTPLAIASFFIDVGMMPLEHLIDKPEALTNEEIELIRHHPVEGANLLPSETSQVNV